jgi:hypothetical protein
MTTAAATEIRLSQAAGRLIAFGLRPRLRPAHHEEYAKLVADYRSDGRFRDLVEGVCDGLGLVILDVGDFGLVVGAAEDSVFAWRLDDYRANLGVDERLLHGLVQLGIASFCFPNAESLDASEEQVVHTVSAAAVERDLRETCLRLQQRLGREDVPEAVPELERALALYLAQASTKDAKVRARKTTMAMVQTALDKLSEQGLLVLVSEVDGGTYKTQARYQIQVRELAAYEGYRMLAAARRQA